tara:strand:- start:3196 stop:3480 length:285 start_codon:yes stop_codon:yes gene_type:complete
MTKYNVYSFNTTTPDYHELEGILTIEDGKILADFIGPDMQVEVMDFLEEAKPTTFEELIDISSVFNRMFIYEVDKDGNEIRLFDDPEDEDEDDE